MHHLSLFVPPAARGTWSLAHTAQAKGLACLLLMETGASQAGEMHARLGDYFLKRIGLWREPPVVVMVVAPPSVDAATDQHPSSTDGGDDGALFLSAGGGAVHRGRTGEGGGGGGGGGGADEPHALLLAPYHLMRAGAERLVSLLVSPQPLTPNP